MVNLTFGLRNLTSPGMALVFIELPLSKLQHAYCFLPTFPTSQPPGPATSKSFCPFSLVRPHKGHPISLNLWRSNCHVETNSLSIFSTFNPRLLVIFSFFCIGSHGNESIGRGSVTLLLAFCTIQNPSSDPQASVVWKGREERLWFPRLMPLIPYPTDVLSHPILKPGPLPRIPSPFDSSIGSTLQTNYRCQDWTFFIQMASSSVSDLQIEMFN